MRALNDEQRNNVQTDCEGLRSMSPIPPPFLSPSFSVVMMHMSSVSQWFSSTASTSHIFLATTSSVTAEAFSFWWESFIWEFQAGLPALHDPGFNDHQMSRRTNKSLSATDLCCCNYHRLDDRLASSLSAFPLPSSTGPRHPQRSGDWLQPRSLASRRGIRRCCNYGIAPAVQTRCGITCFFSVRMSEIIG